MNKKINHKKYFLLLASVMCTQIIASTVRGGVTVGLDPETLATINAFSPSLNRKNIFSVLGFFGALSGMRLIHTGVNQITTPVITLQNSADEKAARTKLQAERKKMGLTRCIAGFTILSCSALTILTCTKN